MRHRTVARAAPLALAAGVLVGCGGHLTGGAGADDDGGVTDGDAAGAGDRGLDGGGPDGGATLAEWPNAENTGVPPGAALTPSGSLVIVEDDRVIDGLDVAGSITVRAVGVVIRNSRVTNDGPAIRLEEGGELLVEDTTLDGAASPGLDGAIVAWGSLTARRLQVTGFGEGVDVFGPGGLIQDSYFHAMGNADGQLMDGIESWGGTQGLVIRHNVIEMPDGNSAIKLPLDVPAPGGDDVLIEGNLLSGGGWTVYGGYDPADSNPSFTNVRFIGNRFSTQYEPRCGFYGPAANVEPGLSSGNAWHETDEPLDL